MRRIFEGLRVAIVLAIALVASGPAGAADETVKLTDPDLLERLGFAAEQRVSIGPRALAELEWQAAAADLEVSESALTESVTPEGTATGHSVVSPAMLQPAQSDMVYFVTASPALLCSGDTPTFEGQIPDLPDGGNLTGARVWYSDSHSTNSLTVVLYRSCLPTSGAGRPIATVLGTRTSTGSSGAQSATIALDETVDFGSCSYLVRVNLGTIDLGCSASLAFYKLRVDWTPPAPPASPEVFGSGFESGNLTGWSAVQS
jgi:hypothetical protein